MEENSSTVSSPLVKETFQNFQLNNESIHHSQLRICILKILLTCLRKIMPYINVKITKDAATTIEQKKQIVEEMTQTLVNVLGKKPEHIHIVIDEIEPENRGFAGLLTTEFRRQKN